MHKLKTLLLPLVIVALTAGSALADGKDKHHGKKPKAHHKTMQCPPGLAKKSPACIPPGLVNPRDRKDDHADNVLRRPTAGYRVGDLIRDDCVFVSYKRYQSLPAGTYCRVDDRLMRIDPETRAVITILQLLGN